MKNLKLLIQKETSKQNIRQKLDIYFQHYPEHLGKNYLFIKERFNLLNQALSEKDLDEYYTLDAEICDRKQQQKNLGYKS